MPKAIKESQFNAVEHLTDQSQKSSCKMRPYISYRPTIYRQYDAVYHIRTKRAERQSRSSESSANLTSVRTFVKREKGQQEAPCDSPMSIGSSPESPMSTGISDSYIIPKAIKKSQFKAVEHPKDHSQQFSGNMFPIVNLCRPTTHRQNYAVDHIRTKHAERQSRSSESSADLTSVRTFVKREKGQQEAPCDSPMSIGSSSESPMSTGIYDSCIDITPKASEKSDIWMRCPQCVHQYIAVEDLKDHLQNFHPPRKQYACNKCSYTADRQYEIERRINRAHAERQSLGHDSSSEMTTPIRTAVKRKITPVPGNAEIERGQQKARPKTPLSPSTHSRPAPSTAPCEYFTGPTARSVIEDAKQEVGQKGLKPKQSKERKGRHYCHVIETVVLPDGKMFRVETEKWDE